MDALLSKPRNAKIHIPKGAVARYNHTRTLLLERMLYPKAHPLHRSAAMAFSTLDWLIMAPTDDTEESQLQRTIRRLHHSTQGDWQLLWDEANTPHIKHKRTQDNNAKQANVSNA